LVYARCVFHILAWMCFLCSSLVLEVDINLYDLTTSMSRMDGRSVTCTTVCITFVAVDVNLMVEPLI
jgi:hypothetical protein